MPSNPLKISSNSDGYALIAVLVFCLILIPVIANFAQSSRVSARNVQTTIETTKIEFLEDGLADIVAAKLSADSDFATPISGAPKTSCSVGDLRISFNFQDHDGKVDLNNANSALLILGFRAAGFTDENANLLQAFVEASRSGTPLSDDLKKRSELPSLKGAPFERVEELDDVVTALNLPQIDLDPYFTVYKRNGSLEFQTAPASLAKLVSENLQSGDFVAEDNKVLEYFDVSVKVSVPRSHRSYSTLRKTYRRETDPGIPRAVAARYVSNDDDHPAELDDHAKVSCPDFFAVDRSAFLHG